MTDERQEVLKLLNNGFTEPSSSEIENSEVDDALARLTAYYAVHEYEPEYRVQMALSVAEKLLSGDSLLVPERAWLLYILRKIGPEKLPNEHRGRAPISSLDKLAMMCRLGEIMNDQEINDPKSKVTDRIEKAALTLNKSYESLRALYYSEEYKALSGHPFFERFCRENTGINN